MNKAKKAYQAKKKAEKAAETNPTAFRKIAGKGYLTPYMSRRGKYGKTKPKRKDHR